MVDTSKKSTSAEEKPRKVRLWPKQTAGMIATEIVIVFALLVAAAFGAFAWRVHKAPLDVGFAKASVEQALRSEQSGRYATMEQIVLHWPDLRGPLLLGLRDLKVFDRDDKVLVSVDEAAISLSRSRLLIGRIAPKALILRQPALRVIRTADGGMDFGFGTQDDVASDDIAGQMALTELILSYVAQPGRQSTVDSPLATLEAFQIEGAKLMIEDHALGVSWFLPRFDAAFQSADQGLVAELYLDLPGSRDEESFVDARVLFAWDSKDVGASVTLKNFDSRILSAKIPGLATLRQQDVVLDAKIDAVLDKDLNLVRGDLDLAAVAGSIQYEGFYTEPLVFKDFALKASYDSASKKLELSEVWVTAKDVTIKATGEVMHEPDSFKGPLKILIEEVQQSQISPLWPEFLRGDNSEKWIVQRMADGTFHNATADMTLEAVKTEEGWSFDVSDLIARWDFENLTVNYRAPMAPVTQAKGSGFYDDNQEKIRVDVESGMIGGLTISKAELEFVNIIAKGQGVADINVKLGGELAKAIEYVSSEPIGLEHDFDLAQVEGTTDLAVNVVFPTVDDIRNEDVKVRVIGTTTDIKLPDAVGALDLTGGPFDVSVKDNVFRVSGKGQLHGQPVDATYEAFLHSKGKPYKSVINASTIATEEMRQILGSDISKFFAGSAPVQVKYTEYHGGRSEAEVAVDMTPARFFVEPFDYEKPVSGKGEATFTARLQNGIVQEITGLKASAANFKLEGGSLTFREKDGEPELSGGQAERFVVDESVGTIEFEITPEGQVKIILEGQVLDLRPFLSPEEGEEQVYEEPPMLISVAVDQMITDDEESVQYGKIYADIDDQGRFNQLEMDAIAGQGDIYLRYKPDETGKRVFRLEADDAGAALKAFGVYENIIGGKLIIYGEPIRGVFDRNLVGLAEITDFTVVRAPALAQLLGIMSLPGLLSALEGEGLNFAKLESQFDWLYRREGSLLVLKEGRTSGNSLGLTFEGTFDKGESMVDVSGTIVPLSEINKVIGSIPLIGDILTGGSGALIAATYTMKGKSDDLKVAVNPLSVLTPGILRRILFENP